MAGWIMFFEQNRLLFVISNIELVSKKGQSWWFIIVKCVEAW